MSVIDRMGVRAFINARLEETNKTLSEQQINDLVDKVMNMSETELAQIGMEALHNEATCTGRFSCKKPNV